jgi:hypothetical protein
MKIGIDYEKIPANSCKKFDIISQNLPYLSISKGKERSEIDVGKFI